MTKMTYVQAIESAINGNLTDEVVEKLEALKGQIAKKNSGERKATKTQVENEKTCADILNWFGEDVVTATDVADAFGISNQKASALLKKLVDGGLVEKFVGEKRRTFFKKVA